MAEVAVYDFLCMVIKGIAISVKLFEMFSSGEVSFHV